MSARRTIALASLPAALLALATPAAAERLVSTLSTSRVLIASNFTGADVVLFGSVERDAQTVARRGGYDIVVTVSGPRETVVTFRKQRVAGVWVNADSRTFVKAPSYLTVLANRTINDIADVNTLRRTQTGLARTSKTPGRTQHLVVFALGPDRRLVDLPGYGYAKVPEAMRLHWRGVIDTYLRNRASLKGLVLVMDARHPLKEFDRHMLEFGAASGRACHCLLTKADKLSRSEGLRTLAAVRKELATFAPEATAQLFSSHAKTGLDEARTLVAGWLDL